jgi:uncharacterized protein (TIGR03435 family)
MTEHFCVEQRQKGLRIISIISLALFAVVELAGQTAPAPRAFEVASIRLNPGPWHVRLGYSSSGPRLTLEAYSISELIEEAYDLKSYRVTFAEPSAQRFVEDTYYNIVAKAEGEGTPTKAEFRQMLQTLLAERFNLKFHHETKEMPVYALVVGKNGPKFKESAPDATFSGHHGVNGHNQTLTLVKVTMESLAEEFKNYFGVERPVIDKTGLTGSYDIKFEATPERRLHAEADPSEISVFTAVQEQLGLKLEAQKAQVEVLVVDHVEKPSEN